MWHFRVCHCRWYQSVSLPVWFQIVMNVISNAGNLSPLLGDRILSVAAWLPWPDVLQIEVADRGPGLRGQTMAQLMIQIQIQNIVIYMTEFSDSYDRVGVSPRGAHWTAIRSSGLGIPICARLAELMGGSVTLADRTDGPGARFTLRLPLRTALDPATEARDASPVAPDSPPTPRPQLQASPGRRPRPVRGTRVLVVDDSPANLRFAVYWLRRAGCAVQTCADGDQVVPTVDAAVATGAPIDLCLMDLRMDRLDGDAALAALRQAGHAALPVVLATAHATAADAERYRGVGFAGLLSKPFSPEQLRVAVARALET